jgi:hypothetical protein
VDILQPFVGVGTEREAPPYFETRSCVRQPRTRTRIKLKAFGDDMGRSPRAPRFCVVEEVVDPKRLKKILAEHALWLAGKGGQRADLHGEDLRGAKFCGTNMSLIDLRWSDLTGADVTDAALRGAVLTGATLRDLAGLPEVPVIPNLDEAILTKVTTGGGKLDMTEWHTSKNRHCRGGWAIVLAGSTGVELESRFGSPVAAALIYYASTGTVPNFCPGTPTPRVNEEALAQLQEAVASQKGEHA